MIRRSDTTVKADGVTPEGGVFVTVKTSSGTIAPIYTDTTAAMPNPFVTNSDGTFAYNVANPDTYTEEYRLTVTDSPRTVRSVNFSNGLGTYLGPVATNAAMPNWVVGNVTPNTYRRFNSRSYHIAAEALTQVKLMFCNFICNLNNGDMNERTTAGAVPMVDVYQTCSIEYPAGTFKQVTFAGSTSGKIALGGFLTSDWATVSIPAGAGFWVRRSMYNLGEPTNSIIPVCSNSADSNTLGDGLRSEATAGVDLTMGGTFTATFTGEHAPPCAVLGMTQRRSFYLAGDSRMMGASDLMGLRGELGEIARSVSGWGFINGGYGNDRASFFVGSHALRTQVMNYCSDIVLGYGVNDIANNRTSTQLLADLATIRSFLPGKQYYAYTLPPFGVTSTDSYATLGNQTVQGYDTQRVAFNNALRAGVTGINRSWEVADVIESSRDSGKWRVDSGTITPDGTHENKAGNDLIGNSSAVVITPYAGAG